MLYQTTAHNHDGINGRVTFSDNDAINTTHPLTKQTGYNPEQLFASAWATCLNATIQSLLASHKQPHPSTVTVTIDLCQDEKTGQYYFDVRAQATIKNLPFDTAEHFVHQAHHRCPISKLLSGATTVSLTTIPYPNKK